jgi:hypothetical protein
VKLMAWPIAALCLAGAAGDAHGCGDKFLRVGRGARYQRGYVAIRPACILLYARPGSALAATMRELAPTLKRAGHNPMVLEDSGGMASAMSRDHPNLILAAIEDVGAVEKAARASARADVLPVLVHPSAGAREDALREYHHVAESPGRKQDLLARIDDVMERIVKGGTNRRKP